MTTGRGLLDARGRAAMAALAAAGAIAFLSGLRADPVRTWGALLVAAFYAAGLAASAAALLAMWHLTGAGWPGVLRRVPEAAAGALPVGAALMGLTALGRRSLYLWSRPEAALHDEVLQAKAAWLNTPAWLLRMALYLAVWLGGAAWLRALSRAQDEGGADPAGAARRARPASAVFLIMFALTFSGASVDWLMSLEPHWYSTMYPWYQFAGAFSSALAAVVVLSVLLRRRGVLAEVNRHHLHDLGRLLFAFSSFWAYLWFCQYLLIWYSNIPEESAHFAARSSRLWGTAIGVDLLLGFLAPFALLMPARAKQDEGRLLWAAGAVLLGRALDLTIAVLPASAAGHGGPGPLEPFILAGAAGAFVLAFDRAFTSAPPVARLDPYLVESLHHGG